MANCFIIHGTMGCPDENWFLWAQTEIAKILKCEKYEVITPHFPYIVGNNPHQGYNLWKELLMVYKDAGLINKDTIFIGHSLGPVFIFRFLEETKTEVKAVISVSGKNNNWLNIKSFDNFNFDFYCDYKKLENSAKYAKYRYAFYSTNDPYISLLNCKKFANAIKAEEIVLQNAGHINTAAGFKEFPQLLDVVKKIMRDEPIVNTASKNFLDLEEPIEESADIIYNNAQTLCAGGIMDDNCLWYHGTWQYLRLMNLVSTPAWHDTFYQNELMLAFNRKKSAKVLISGAADYSMLAYVLYSAKQVACKVEVDVLDTCKTALFACEWFANKQNVKINTINESILDYNKNNYYNIICTDAFLTRFNKEDAQKVVNKWHSLLKEDGKVITTVRIYENNTKLTKAQLEEKSNAFADKAKERSVKIQEHIQFSPNKIQQMAKQYALNMKSNNLGNKEEIENLFNKFIIKSDINNVLGEFDRTKYLELVATKN